LVVRKKRAVDVKADQMLGEITCAVKPIPSIIQPHCHWRKELNLIYNEIKNFPFSFFIHHHHGTSTDRIMENEVPFERYG